MRKRNCLIGIAGALALSVAVSGTAHAAGTLLGQTITPTVAAGKLDKKKKNGPINSVNVSVDTAYSGSTPPFTGKAINTKIDFPSDWAVNAKGLPQCDPAAIGTVDTATALSQCGNPNGIDADIGTGFARLAGPIAGVTANVTAFNGTTPEGLPTLLLHSRTTANTTTVLIGTFRKSDQGSKYGQMLDVPVPLLLGGAFVITHFDTTIPKTVTKKGKVKKKKNKKTGKVTKKKIPPTFYVSARCKTGKWAFQGRSSYDNGATTVSNPPDVTCKQKKSKKKKKKKKK